MQQLSAALATFQQESSVRRWVWNSLPENCGLAIVHPSVVAAMEDCHAMVREKVPDAEMWHLISGAHVRGQFATMVSETLNTAPGELQYPHYNSTRPEGTVTGTRVSSGRWRSKDAVQRVRKSCLWFESVYYGPSEAWTQAQTRVPETKVMFVLRPPAISLSRTRANWGV